MGVSCTSMGTVTASLGWPPGPLLPPSSLSLPLSDDGVVCDGAPPTEGTDAADPEPGLVDWKATASGVCADPGGGKLGGGIDVSMVGRARAGDGAGDGPEACGVGAGACIGAGVGVGVCVGGAAGVGALSSIGANLASVAVEALLLRVGSLLRAGMMCVCVSIGSVFKGRLLVFPFPSFSLSSFLWQTRLDRRTAPPRGDVPDERGPRPVEREVG